VIAERLEDMSARVVPRAVIETAILDAPIELPSSAEIADLELGTTTEAAE